MNASNKRLRIALGQLDMLVGDVAGNAQKIVAAAERACSDLDTDLLVLPELTLSGYPPEDLLFHRGFRVAVEKGMATLKSARSNCGFLVGFPEYAGAQIFNSAALIEAGEVRATHRKSCLPNYKVFDEKRYFKAGSQPTVVDYRGFRSACWCAKTSGSRNPPSWRARPARRCSWCSTLRRSRSTSNATARTSSGAA